MVKTFYDSDKKRLDNIALEIITGACKKTLLRKKDFIFAIPGGRAVQGILKNLKDADGLPWQETHIFMVDERLVSPQDRKSNFFQAKALFIDHLVEKNTIDKKNIHPFILTGNVKEDLQRYEHEIKEHGSKYDLVILSAGQDCHVGSLFPGHSSVADDAEYFIHVQGSPKPPKERVSASRKMILRSDYCVLMFYGESKREAYWRFKDKKEDIISCPAKIAKGIENSYLLTDIC